MVAYLFEHCEPMIERGDAEISSSGRDESPKADKRTSCPNGSCGATGLSIARAEAKQMTLIKNIVHKVLFPFIFLFDYI